MKTLSIQQPWASLVCAGIKDMENRTWKTTELPGRILIHASSKKVTRNFFAGDELQCYIDNNVFFGNLPQLDTLPTSAIIGYVTVVGFETGYTGSVWDGGPTQIKWKLADAWLFDEPIMNVKGQLHLFDYDIDENNLPPAHQVELNSIDINDNEDEIIIPCLEVAFNQIKEGDSFPLFLTDDIADLLCTNEKEAKMKPFKSVTLVCGDKYRKFELTKESGIYWEPDPTDETKPYEMEFHDGQWGQLLFAEFDLGKQIDEGELDYLCGGKIIVDPNMVKMVKDKEGSNVLKFKVSKDTFESIVNDQMSVFTKEINLKNLSTFFVTNEDGTVKEIKGIPQLRPYDTIQFTNKDDSYSCQINDANVVYMDYESGEYILYSELDKDERKDITDYMIAYALGDKI